MTKLLTDEGRFTLVHQQYEQFSDFNYYVTGDDFSTVVSDSGTVSVSDGAKGILAIIPSDGSVADNDEGYVKGTKEVFLFAADKPIIFEALVQFTEANTDDANVIVGMKDAVAADSVLDNGGGPATSYSGMLFFKADGDTVWSVETSIGGTQTTTQLTSTNKNNLSGVNQTAGGAAYQRLRAEFAPYSSTKGQVSYRIDGVLVAVHDFTYTNATEMQLCAGIKNGGTNLETLNVDYMGAIQRR